jgi:hypothetical protein
MATAHSYLRYSCPEQALGDSERRQIENARQWAAANGHDYDDSYRDPVSAPSEAKIGPWVRWLGSLMMSDPGGFRRAIC